MANEIKAKVQKMGGFLSGMVMPNIGALIAWGIVTALFLETGYFPNEKLAELISPTLTYLIPILFGYTGGYNVYGRRGAVAGTVATIGVVVGADVTMMIGGMIMGPLGAWIIKQVDKALDGHVKPGMEMLVDNFSMGIVGAIMMIAGYAIVTPIFAGITNILTVGVNFMISHNILPFTEVFVVPGQVLFLNNAINHGIFTPLATEQAAEFGKSIMYMLEPNPGPGLGVLLAYMFFCKDKVTKDSAPGAVIIHLLGGIHEIYFPYILMNPLVIVAPILGNMAAIFWFSVTDCGLVGPASPGSIIAYLMMSPGSDMLKVIIGVLIATGISFAVASPIVKMAGGKSLEEAQNEVASMKAASKGENAVPGTIERSSEIRKIIFACDAGMGSSAMGATKFRNRIKNDRPDIKVSNTSVDNIPADCDIAVVQTTLAARAKKSAPQAQLITIGNFLADPALDALYVQLTTGDAPAAPAGENTDIVIPDTPIKKQVIVAEGIKLGQKPVSKEEAIQAAGELLVKLGYVDESYVDAMQEREKLVSTYMGMGVAIPHGTTQAKGTVKKTGIVFIQYPEGVDFGAEKAQLVFGIAGIGDEHLDLLGKLCTLLEDPALLETLKTTDDVNWVLEQLS